MKSRPVSLEKAAVVSWGVEESGYKGQKKEIAEGVMACGYDFLATHNPKDYATKAEFEKQIRAHIKANYNYVPVSAGPNKIGFFGVGFLLFFVIRCIISSIIYLYIKWIWDNWDNKKGIMGSPAAQIYAMNN
jgi:hypothetical protein